MKIQHSSFCLFLILIVLFSACGSDDVNGEIPEMRENALLSALVGQWQVVEINSRFPLDQNGDGVSTTSLHLEEDCLLQSGFIYSAEKEWESINPFTAFTSTANGELLGVDCYDPFWEEEYTTYFDIDEQQISIFSVFGVNHVAYNLNGDNLELIDLFSLETANKVDVKLVRQ